MVWKVIISQPFSGSHKELEGRGLTQDHTRGGGDNPEDLTREGVMISLSWVVADLAQVTGPNFPIGHVDTAMKHL